MKQLRNEKLKDIIAKVDQFGMNNSEFKKLIISKFSSQTAKAQEQKKIEFPSDNHDLEIQYLNQNKKTQNKFDKLLDFIKIQNSKKRSTTINDQSDKTYNSLAKKDLHIDKPKKRAQTPVHQQKNHRSLSPYQQAQLRSISPKAKNYIELNKNIIRSITPKSSKLQLDSQKLVSPKHLQISPKQRSFRDVLNKQKNIKQVLSQGENRRYSSQQDEPQSLQDKDSMFEQQFSSKDDPVKCNQQNLHQFGFQTFSQLSKQDKLSYEKEIKTHNEFYNHLKHNLDDYNNGVSQYLSNNPTIKKQQFKNLDDQITIKNNQNYKQQQQNVKSNNNQQQNLIIEDNKLQKEHLIIDDNKSQKQTIKDDGKQLLQRQIQQYQQLIQQQQQQQLQQQLDNNKQLTQQQKQQQCIIDNTQQKQLGLQQIQKQQFIDNSKQQEQEIKQQKLQQSQYQSQQQQLIRDDSKQKQQQFQQQQNIQFKQQFIKDNSKYLHKQEQQFQQQYQFQQKQMLNMDNSKQSQQQQLITENIKQENTKQQSKIDHSKQFQLIQQQQQQNIQINHGKQQQQIKIDNIQQQQKQQQQIIINKNQEQQNKMLNNDIQQQQLMQQQQYHIQNSATNDFQIDQQLFKNQEKNDIFIEQNILNQEISKEYLDDKLQSQQTNINQQYSDNKIQSLTKIENINTNYLQKTKNAQDSNLNTQIDYQKTEMISTNNTWSNNLEINENITYCNMNFILMEGILGHIQQIFKQQSEIIVELESYIRLIKKAEYDQLPKFISNEFQKLNVIQTMIKLEFLSVVTILIQQVTLLNDKQRLRLSEESQNHYLILMQYIHQNTVLLIEFLIEKSNQNAENQVKFNIFQSINYLSKFTYFHNNLSDPCKNRSNFQKFIFKKLIIKKDYLYIIDIIQKFIDTLRQILLLKKTRNTSKVSKFDIIERHNKIIINKLNIIYKQNNHQFQIYYEPLNNILSNLQQLSAQEIISILLEFSETIIKQKNKQTKKSAKPKLPVIGQIANRQYTLILDLDETLIRFEETDDDGGYFLVRPFAQEFLVECSQYYEIIIFTAAQKEYADTILNEIDKENNISHRLYRENCTRLEDGSYRKDISLLGRDLNRCIIIDNLAENFQLQAENGIFIQSWYNEPDDRALPQLLPLLIQIVQKNINTPEALRQYREIMFQNIQNGVQNPHLNLQLQ